MEKIFILLVVLLSLSFLIAIISIILLTKSEQHLSKEELCNLCPSTPIPEHFIFDIDPLTDKKTKEKYIHEDYVLIFSDEMKSMERIKSHFRFENQPFGTLGTGAQNYVADPKLQTLIKESNANFLRLKTAPVDGTKRKDLFINSIPNGPLWNSSKMTGASNCRFLYGRIECSIRCPSLVGVWPAFWLNFCSGAAQADGKYNSLIDDYPFLCESFWPPEIDIMERYSPNLFEGSSDAIKYDKPTQQNNQSSVHSANQYTGMAVQKNKENLGQWCPNGTCDAAPNKQPNFQNDCNSYPCEKRKPFQGYCFGVSKFYKDVVNPSTNFITYRCDWTPEQVSFYMDGVCYGTITNRDLVMYKNGSVAPVKIPNLPLFPIWNTAILDNGGPDQAGSQGGNRPGLEWEYNYIEDKLKETGLDIQWFRVYQHKDWLTGINPTWTKEMTINAFNSKTGGSRFNPMCSLSNQDKDKSVEYLSTVCSKLSEVKDNTCLSIDAVMMSNDGGIANMDENTATMQKANDIAAYAAANYGICCSINESGKVECKTNYDYKLPKNVTENKFYNSFGWPPQPINVPPPCNGTQTFFGDDLSQYKCS